MALSRLELISSHGDETVSATRVVLHAAVNATETVVLRDAGLAFVPGESVVTTNLSYIYEQIAGKEASGQSEPGMAFCRDPAIGVIPRVRHIYHCFY